MKKIALLLATLLTTSLAVWSTDLGENQLIMGHYNTDSLLIGGNIGLTGFEGVIPIATILSPSELEPFQGGKIVAFRVGLSASTPVTRVFVAPVKGNDLSTLTYTEWSCNVSQTGWNTIELATPYEIDLDSETSLLIGFDFTQAKKSYPISAVAVGDYYPTYAYLTYQGTTNWIDINMNKRGNLNLSVQCIVENENFEKEHIVLDYLNSLDYTTKIEGTLPFTFKAKNQGTSTIEANQYTFTYSIDGNMMGTITGPQLGNEWVDYEGAVDLSDIAAGEHTLTISTATINGQAVEEISTVSWPFALYSRLYPRQKHLVEQLTSTSCTYCPRGTSTLEALCNLRNDIAWVSIHGVQSKSYPDPYNTTQCDSLNSYLGLTGWPTAAFDRMLLDADNQSILTTISYSQSEQAEAAQSISDYLDSVTEDNPSYASIDIATNVDTTTRVATITISGDIVESYESALGKDARLSVYLTEDSLVYSQLNAGTWISDYVHHTVFRQALAGVAGMPLNVTGTTYKNVYTTTLPESWNANNMNVVAFISRPVVGSDFSDKYVNNAETTPLIQHQVGDVNHDGTIDVNDVTALIAMILGNGTGCNTCANVNGDNTIDVNDVTALISLILGN